MRSNNFGAIDDRCKGNPDATDALKSTFRLISVDSKITQASRFSILVALFSYLLLRGNIFIVVVHAAVVRPGESQQADSLELGVALLRLLLSRLLRDPARRRNDPRFWS